MRTRCKNSDGQGEEEGKEIKGRTSLFLNKADCSAQCKTNFMRSFTGEFNATVLCIFIDILIFVLAS